MPGAPPWDPVVPSCRQRSRLSRDRDPPRCSVTPQGESVLMALLFALVRRTPQFVDAVGAIAASVTPHPLFVASVIPRPLFLGESHPTRRAGGEVQEGRRATPRRTPPPVRSVRILSVLGPSSRFGASTYRGGVGELRSHPGGPWWKPPGR